MNLKLLKAMLLLSLLFGTGCVRRTVTQDFGLTGITSAPRPKPQSARSPDASLRAVFKQQTQGALNPTQGAFNPLSDDRHIQELQSEVKSNPRDAKARLELAAAYEKYHLYGPALDQYKEALAQLVSTDALAEQATIGLSRSARASHRIAEAVPILEGFLAQQPLANSWNELGLLYEDMAFLSAAQNAFENAIATTPESDSAHNNLGYNLLLQSRLDAAEAEFRKAVDLNPRSPTARNNLGTTLARRGDLQGALEQFLITADAASAHNNLAVVLLEAGQYEQSRQQLVEALNIRHYFTPALANFKLVQERIREEAEVKKYGRLPLNPVRPPSSLVALGQVMTLEPEDKK